MTYLAVLGVFVAIGTYVGIAYAERAQRIDDHIERFFRGDGS